ncbi:MAG: potassium channel protein [Cyclobacteriaceae bacterium]|nr:potassium channel protein [Cyclobacteriaceae bacterium]
MLLVSIGTGTITFTLLEDYSLLDAFYMTMLMVSTVGFREVSPLSDNGKIFASLYMMFNLGIYAYIVSVISRYIFEGEFKKIFTTFIFNNKTKKLKNHVIVVGYGKTGARTCEELLKNEVQFILIEHDPHVLQYLPENPRFQILKEDATREEVLMKARIEVAKSLIVTLPNDTDNMIICITAKGINPNLNIIARASEESAEKKLYRAGANKVVKPFAIGGIHMAHLITQPYVIEFLEILTGIKDQDLQLEEYMFNELKEDFKNKTIKELDIRQNTGATVIGVKDPEKGFIFDPNSETIIKKGDVLIVLGSHESLKKFQMYCV